jgi:hypothetical protein
VTTAAGNLVLSGERAAQGQDDRARFTASRCLHQWQLATPTKGEPAIGKIIISENVSLDGVIRDPVGDEDFGRGGWAGRVGG